ncbi:hypothetical protein ACVIGA_006497 [Bradyrhizobium sp. USDA 3240]
MPGLCPGHPRFWLPSFRGDAEHRTRNLEIPGSPFGRPGMTEADKAMTVCPRPAHAKGGISVQTKG